MIRVEVGVDDEARTAVLAVHDQGLGIPAPDVSRIFDRFERGSNVVGVIAGTGIGLGEHSTCRGEPRWNDRGVQ